MAETFTPRAEDPGSGWLAGPWGMCRRLLRTGERSGSGYSRKGCGRPTIASTLRGRTRPQRWGYCALHLADYGRTVRHAAVWWDPDGARTVIRSYGETPRW